MADGFGYGGFSGVPYPSWLSSPSPHPSASAPPFLTNPPVESYDRTQGGLDPMFSHRSPADWSNNPSYRENSRSQTPSSSFYADNSRLGNFGPRGEDSYRDMFSPNDFYSARASSSSDFVSLPADTFSERQRLYFAPSGSSATSAPVSSFGEMLIRNSQSQEPFFNLIAPSDVYASSSALDENHPRYYHPGFDKPDNMNVVPGPPPVESYVYAPGSISSLPMPSLKTGALFDEDQTGIHLGDGRSFNTDVGNHAPDNSIGNHSSLHGSSVEPVNFDVLLGYGEATGHVKPLSENPDFCYQIVGSPGSRSPQASHPLQFSIDSSSALLMEKGEGSGVSSLYQKPITLDAGNGNCVSESFMKKAVEDLNFHEPRYWSHFMVSSEGPSAPNMFSRGSEPCGPGKANNGNAQSTVNYKTPSGDSANQPSEDVQANQKPCNLQEQMFNIMNRETKTTLLPDMGLKGSVRSNADDVCSGQSPERHLYDHGDFPSPTSSPRVSCVVNAMHNLSEVLVYECFNNGSWLKLEQLENLDKVVDNLTKCLKKITANKAIPGEASLPNQDMHVSSPNVVNLSKAPKVVTKDFEGFNVKQVDSFGFKEREDKNEMTQRIKNILSSNFPDGEENHPETLLYKNLWLETEAALCSTTCMARYHRIKNETGNPKSQSTETSADISTFMQEPFLNPQKSVPITNNVVEQETTESLIKHGGNNSNNVGIMSHDAPQSSRFNSDPVDALLSLMSRSFTGGVEKKKYGNYASTTSGMIQDAILGDSAASATEEKRNDVVDEFVRDPDIDVIERFQILKQQETDRKLKSQNCPETQAADQENNPEALEMANIGRSSHVGDVMDRFQILKRREAEQVEKPLQSLNIDTDSDNDHPRNKAETYGKGYESPTSDWEHVIRDD